jgi:hypothetical protein
LQNYFLNQNIDWLLIVPFFRQSIGGTVASTEELIRFLATSRPVDPQRNPVNPDLMTSSDLADTFQRRFRIRKILLAVGEVDGVLDQVAVEQDFLIRNKSILIHFKSFKVYFDALQLCFEVILI